MMKIPRTQYFLVSHQCVQVGLIGKIIAMSRRVTSEATIEAIIESVITRSLAGQQHRVLDIGQRHFQEGEGYLNSMEVFEDELTMLSRDFTALMLDLQAMEESLRATRRRRRSLYRLPRRELHRRPLGARNLEGEGRRRQRLEVGLERIRQRRLNR